MHKGPHAPADDAMLTFINFAPLNDPLLPSTDAMLTLINLAPLSDPRLPSTETSPNHNVPRALFPIGTKDEATDL